MASASSSNDFTEDALKKRKAVIRISMNNEHSRCKALKIAVRTRGVESVVSKRKNELVVVGVGVNWHNLMAAMNTKIGPATLVKMTEIRRGWGVLRKLYKPILIAFHLCAFVVSELLDN